MNVDKDIEIVRKIIENKKGVLEYYKRDAFGNYPIKELENEIQAIENVLKELETYKKIAKERIKSDLRIFAYCLNESELEQRAEELIEKLRKEVENENRN